MNGERGLPFYSVSAVRSCEWCCHKFMLLSEPIIVKLAVEKFEVFGGSTFDGVYEKVDFQDKHIVISTCARDAKP